MNRLMTGLAALLATAPLMASSTELAQATDAAVLTPQTINSAALSDVPVEFAPVPAQKFFVPGSAASKGWPTVQTIAVKQLPSPAVARM